jgi:hypothetical protein
MSFQCEANIVINTSREIFETVIQKGGKEAAKGLTRLGGRQAIEEMLEKAAKAGGDELVEIIARISKKYGVTAIKVIKHSPALYARALDKLPDNMVKRALWAAEREPEVVTGLLKKHGSDVLEIAARFPGVGVNIVAKLGDDGIRVAKKLTERQAILLARHADEIADLPAHQRRRLLDVICEFPQKYADFAEKYPKVTLGTGIGIYAFVTKMTDITMGQDDEVIIYPDGSKKIVNKGLIERVLETKPVLILTIVIGAIIAFIGVVKIWGTYRKEKARIRNLEESENYKKE